MIKKILITSGIGLAVYLVNYMRKEYDKNVADYNHLVDKYNATYKINKLGEPYKYRLYPKED